ncbi:MAG: GGDEF domain-containing protein [Candidatus Aegiribacteria sp.]|nr:GGDEF domain-containing protein [Candidatus Aegiribacteria sp.]
MKTARKTEPLSLPEVENLLENTGGKSRADLLNKLAALVVINDKDRGRKISSEALELSGNLGYRRGKAAALFGLGDAARIGGEYRAALEYYATSLDIFEVLGDPIQQGRCLRRLGDVQFYVNNLNLSLKHYLNSLMIFEKTAEKTGSAEAKINCGHLMATIGNVLRDSGDLEASLDYYRRCHLIYIREGFTAGIPGILYNTGNIFHSQNRFDEALDVYRQALEEAEESGDDYLESLALSSLGSVYMDSGELDAAEDHFSRSMDIAEKQDRRRGILSSRVKLVELGRLQGNLDEALDQSRLAEQLAGQLEDRKSLTIILKERTLIHRRMAEYEKALETSLAFQKLSEELLSEKRVREIDILRVRYETEAKEREIELLRRERTVQRRMIIGAVVGLAFTGISLVLVFRNVRFRIRVNRELADAYSRVEKLSQADTLTGLANRRAMMKSLAAEQTRSSRTGRSFGLIMTDIDDFKQVNDRYGHACGDEILVEVSKRLEKALRNQDITARWGGEEFLLLLPETSLHSAVKVARKTKVLIEETPFICSNASINLTMTFGVSEGGVIPVEDAIQLADTALYRGKRTGKNSVNFQSSSRKTVLHKLGSALRRAHPASE